MSSLEECLEFLETIPFGTFDYATSNTVACRQIHIILTLSRPDVSCSMFLTAFTDLGHLDSLPTCGSHGWRQVYWYGLQHILLWGWSHLWIICRLDIHMPTKTRKEMRTRLAIVRYSFRYFILATSNYGQSHSQWPRPMFVHIIYLTGYERWVTCMWMSIKILDRSNGRRISWGWDSHWCSIQGQT